MSFSVLMSVYKLEKAEKLDRSLRSVWDDQILKPDEIVLIEDGPLGEDLQATIGQWKTSLGDKMTIVVNNTNLGLTKSLNKGIKVIEYDYIARMDSDDASLPDRFKLQVDYMESHPEVVASSGSVDVYDEQGNFLYTKSFPLDNKAARKRICKSSPLSHPCSIIRTSIFKQGISYNEEYRTSQDLALWFDIMKNGYEVGNIPESILRFEYDDALFKRRSLDKAKKEFKIYMNGIKSLYGIFSWRYMYPIARYAFRRMPLPLIKLIYNSKLKNKFS